MDTISIMVNVSNVNATLLAPIIVFVIKPVASVAVCQTSRVEGAMQPNPDFSSGHLIISDLKQKIFPIQR